MNNSLNDRLSGLSFFFDIVVSYFPVTSKKKGEGREKDQGLRGNQNKGQKMVTFHGLVRKTGSYFYLIFINSDCFFKGI